MLPRASSRPVLLLSGAPALNNRAQLIGHPSAGPNRMPYTRRAHRLRPVDNPSPENHRDQADTPDQPWPAAAPSPSPVNGAEHSSPTSVDRFEQIGLISVAAAPTRPARKFKGPWSDDQNQPCGA